MKRSWLIFFLCFVALILLASFFLKSELWGMSAWGALSPFIGLACAIAVIPQLFLRSSFDPFRRIPRIRSNAVALLASAAVSIAVLWLLRSRHELWGERFALGGAIEQGAYRPSAPLSTFIQWAFYRFMNATFLWSAGSVLTFFGIIAGALYALCAYFAAGLLIDEEEEGGMRGLAAAALLANGFAALFFGCGGNAPIAALATIAFMLTGLQFARGGRSLTASALILVAAVLSHVSAVFLVPAFLYLFAAGIRAPGTRNRSIIALGIVLLSWIASEAALPLVAGTPGPARIIAAVLKHSFDQWRGGALTAFSNAINAFLIIGPASAVSLFLLASLPRRSAPKPSRRTSPNEMPFLTVCAISAVVLFVFGAGLLDGGMRWHVIATTGPAFSLCALWALKERTPERERLARILSALFLIGVFHTLPLVLVDAIPRAAQRRLLELRLPPGSGEMIIADAALEKGDLDKARAWYLASLEKNKSNAVVDLRLGRLAMKREEYAEAITHFLNAHELAPDSPRYRFELAEALIAKLWYPEAIAQLETLTVAYPDSVAFWRRLGYARNNGGAYQSAIPAYERSLALEPGNEENVRNLVSALLNRASELQRAKEYDEARPLYERSTALYPRDWRAYNNLAIIEMDLGHYPRAYEILDGALELHPYESSLNFNMGIVLEKLGRDKEALDRMRAARDLDPVYSQAPMHIERLEKRLGVRETTQGDSQRSPLKMP